MKRHTHTVDIKKFWLKLTLCISFDHHQLALWSSWWWWLMWLIDRYDNENVYIYLSIDPIYWSFFSIYRSIIFFPNLLPPSGLISILFFYNNWSIIFIWSIIFWCFLSNETHHPPTRTHKLVIILIEKKCGQKKIFSLEWLGFLFFFPFVFSCCCCCHRIQCLFGKKKQRKTGHFFHIFNNIQKKSISVWW